MLQSGRGLKDIGPILKAQPLFQRGYGPNFIIRQRYRQRGRGLGSVFSSVFNYFKPLLAQGLKTIAKEALQAGVDIVENKQGQPFKQIFQERGREAVQNLKRKAVAKIDPLMVGSGVNSIKRRRKLRGPSQSLVVFRKPDVLKKLQRSRKKQRKQKNIKKKKSNRKIDKKYKRGRKRTLDIFD